MVENENDPQDDETVAKNPYQPESQRTDSLLDESNEDELDQFAHTWSSMVVLVHQSIDLLMDGLINECTMDERVHTKKKYFFLKNIFFRRYSFIHSAKEFG